MSKSTSNTKSPFPKTLTAAMSTDETRRHMCAVMVRDGESLATDGCRLHWSPTCLADGRYGAKGEPGADPDNPFDPRNVRKLIVTSATGDLDLPPSFEAVDYLDAAISLFAGRTRLRVNLCTWELEPFLFSDVKKLGNLPGVRPPWAGKMYGGGKESESWIDARYLRDALKHTGGSSIARCFVDGGVTTLLLTSGSTGAIVMGLRA